MLLRRENLKFGCIFWPMKLEILQSVNFAYKSWKQVIAPLQHYFVIWKLLITDAQSPEPNKTLSLTDELTAFFEKQETAEKFDKLKEKSVILSGMKMYENNPSTRPPTLEKLYKALMTIPPTSVESERTFSTESFYGNKIRSRLDDESLNALIFLKNFFKN